MIIAEMYVSFLPILDSNQRLVHYKKARCENQEEVKSKG